MAIDLLKSILDDEFVRTLAKSADLYKIGSNTVLDPEEIRIGLKVVPRAVMSMLISELGMMQINQHKEIKLPFGNNAYMAVNKNAADDYTGSVYSDNKLVYDFMNRSIPGLGIILLSTFELYNVENFSKPDKESSELSSKIQKLIDEKMELHSLVSKVVEEKISQREALHKMMMHKLTEMVNKPPVPTTINLPEPVINKAITMSSPPAGMMAPVKNQNVVKKELPLKKFLDRKKKPKTYSVEMVKSESISCDSCGKTIFGEAQGFSGCICYGQDMNKKIWIKKAENGVHIRFSRGWDPENIEQLLETLRKSNGKN